MPDHREFARILHKRGYTGIEKIGEGSFGVAVLVEDKDGSKAVCKMVDVSRASSNETREARMEARLLSRLKHPFIVRYRENFADRGWLGILMDFCEGGDLGAQIEDGLKRKTPLEEEKIIRWFSCAMLALKYLHSQHVLHRDLKPANLFLSGEGICKVGDFGVSKVLSCTAAFAHTLIGTPYYLSPELMSEKPYTWPSDIWAMGGILYHLCALRVPFDAASILELSKKVKGSRPSGLPARYSAPLRELCLDMLNKRPDARPNADAVIRRPVIQEVVRKMLEKEKEEKEESAPRPKCQFEVMEQFQVFDENGDGVIERDELAHVLKRLNADVWTDDAVEQMMRYADVNKDGRIQLDEFIHWIFGGDGDIGMIERAHSMITLAQKALESEDLSLLTRALKRWQQMIDIGYLRVSPPDVSVRACDSLARLALESRSLLESDADASAGFLAGKRMSVILLSVGWLLQECAQLRLRRICSVESARGLSGFCVELASGVRLGEAPKGLSDSGLASAGAKWEALPEGEYFVEVRGTSIPAPAPAPKARRRPSGGVGRAPSPPPPAPDDSLVQGIILYTNADHEIVLGSGVTGDGEFFSYKAPEGHEIEELLFNSGTCAGIRTAPLVVSWPQHKLQEIQTAFDLAAEALFVGLLRLSWRAGSLHGRYAWLQARRLGVNSQYVPEEIMHERVRLCAEAGRPSYWVDAEHETGAVPLDVGTKEFEALQALLTACYCRKCSRPATKAKIPDRLELVRATRLQKLPAWATFESRRELVRAELRDFRASSDHEIHSITDLETEGRMTSIPGASTTPRDQDVNAVWLFHAVDASVAEHAARDDFDMYCASSHAGSGLYGHGIYFTESSSRADELSVGKIGADGLHCMLLCRCTLGNILVDEEVLPDVVGLMGQCIGGSYHSILGDRKKRCPDFQREFVVYDADQVYPEFLLQYRRVYE